MGLTDRIRGVILREQQLEQALDRLSGSPRSARPAEAQPAARVREATSEDWFWGRLSSTGTEEDYFWRRLSDNWTQKDVLPATYLEIHNQVFEAYNANPMANAIVEM